MFCFFLSHQCHISLLCKCFAGLCFSRYTIEVCSYLCRCTIVCPVPSGCGAATRPCPHQPPPPVEHVERPDDNRKPIYNRTEMIVASITIRAKRGRHLYQ